jgi:hypothetical protein
MRAIQRLAKGLGVCALAAASLIGATANAQSSCIGVADVGAPVIWNSGQPYTLRVHNFRGFFDPVTGHSHFFGFKHGAGVGELCWWVWDGAVWHQRDTSPIIALYPPDGESYSEGVFDAALDPTTRIALISIKQGYYGAVFAINIDDPGAPVPQFDPQGVPFTASWVDFAEDEGAFYLTSGGLRQVWRYKASDGSLTQVLDDFDFVLSPGSPVDSEYDPITRRIVFVGYHTGIRTFFFGLDNPGFVESTTSMPAPPHSLIGANSFKLVRNSDTGDMLLIGSRSTTNQSFDYDGVWRLSEDDGWGHIAQLTLSDDRAFLYKPGAVYDAVGGQILLFGGVLGGEEISSINQPQPIAITLRKPQFAAQPRSVVVPEGSPFSLVGIPTTNSFYSQVRWLRNGSLIATTALPVLDFENATPDIAGEYVAMLRSTCGSTLSETFHVTVVRGPDSCPGDTSGDGVVNFLDLNSVLSNYGQACD